MASLAVDQCKSDWCPYSVSIYSIILMAKGASSKDKKSGEKGKGKGKAEETADKGGKVRSILYPFFALLCVDFAKHGKGMKAATAINVRHILCEKHSKATEALQRIQVRSFNMYLRLRGREAAIFLLRYNICPDRSPLVCCPRYQAGERFDKVAQECSEDKAKGILLDLLSQFMESRTQTKPFSVSWWQPGLDDSRIDGGTRSFCPSDQKAASNITRRAHFKMRRLSSNHLPWTSPFFHLLSRQILVITSSW